MAVFFADCTGLGLVPTDVYNVKRKTHNNEYLADCVVFVGVWNNDLRATVIR